MNHPYTYNTDNKTYTFIDKEGKGYDIPLDYILNSPHAKVKNVLSLIYDADISDAFILSLVMKT